MGEQGWHAERGWQRMDPAKRDAFIAQRQKVLHDKLKIQPKQEAARKAYTESMKPGQMMPPLKRTRPPRLRNAWNSKSS
ncbi:hypothetical protein GKE73_07935 [Paludibacterium sp. dN 18-1]|uniref:Uncharacterized protein n=1 Tax=Paludibacterium denitrificans TaxID=2675226 RepID=A0A844GBI0_9NEIS|nr:hypothetical protein [Paludibacterium denitrificans]